MFDGERACPLPGSGAQPHHRRGQVQGLVVLQGRHRHGAAAAGSGTATAAAAAAAAAEAEHGVYIFRFSAGGV